MFKLIYTADLHGNESFYKRLLKKAEDENVSAVVIGGDLCPKGGINNQKFFQEKFLIPLFKQFKQKNKDKEIYLIMGNDDFRANLQVLQKSDEVGILKLIHKKSVKLNNKCNIAGYSFVNPTPFRLKDWEKPEFENDKIAMQLFLEEIRTAEKEGGTIEEDLIQLKKLSNPKKTVYVIHAPPFNTKLDIITTGTHVGSKAIRRFIGKEHPLLTLHGHIHESPKMSGSWRDKLGKTICINVGSRYPEYKLNCVVIDADDLNDIKYFEIRH